MHFRGDPEGPAVREETPHPNTARPRPAGPPCSGAAEGDPPLRGGCTPLRLLCQGNQDGYRRHRRPCTGAVPPRRPFLLSPLSRKRGTGGTAWHRLQPPLLGTRRSPAQAQWGRVTGQRPRPAAMVYISNGEGRRGGGPRPFPATGGRRGTGSRLGGGRLGGVRPAPGGALPPRTPAARRRPGHWPGRAARLARCQIEPTAKRLFAAWI